MLGATLTAVGGSGKENELVAKGVGNRFDANELERVIAEGGVLKGVGNDKATFDRLGFGNVESGRFGADCPFNDEKIV